MSQPDPLFWKHQRTVKYDQQIIQYKKAERRRNTLYAIAAIVTLAAVVILGFFGSTL